MAHLVIQHILSYLIMVSLPPLRQLEIVGLIFSGQQNFLESMGQTLFCDFLFALNYCDQGPTPGPQSDSNVYRVYSVSVIVSNGTTVC